MSRSQAVLICKMGTSLCLLAVIATFVWEVSYLFRLTACFALFLFSFHWMFGAKRNLTVTQARMIDYAYLGIAAIGIFIYAMNQEDKRYEYQQLEVQDVGRNGLSKSLVVLESSLVDLQGAACAPDAVQAMPQHCERVKQLMVAFAAQKPSEENQAFIRIVKDYLSSVPSRATSDEYSLQLYRRIESANENLKHRVLSVEIDIMYIKVQEPLPPPDIREKTIYGLFTWPFVLAFAFALRITKTTIEVFDWAASKPTT